jgi:hypothetical protein
MQRLRDALEELAKSCVAKLLLTDDAERVTNKLKQNFGNTTSIMNQLEEDINQFPENITATVASFGDENEANHKQVLRKLMNKLPDYFKMHWAIHVEQHQSRKPTLNVFLDWFNRQNYIAWLILKESSRCIN